VLSIPLSLGYCRSYLPTYITLHKALQILSFPLMLSILYDKLP